MVLGKNVIDGHGGRLGRIVDVGLYAHDRVKFLVVEDKEHRIPIRTVGVDAIDNVGRESVQVRVRA
jgi:sporulation protein YlmC with PRC-barrel domain